MTRKAQPPFVMKPARESAFAFLAHERIRLLILSDRLRDMQALEYSSYRNASLALITHRLAEIADNMKGQRNE